MGIKNLALRLNAAIINSLIKRRGELSGIQTNMRYQKMLSPLLLETKCRYGKIIFYAPSEIALERATTFESKEPDTLRWIDTFKKNAVFWDIGANVGCYSLYAAKKGDVKIYSFEPSYANYFLLCKNIEANGLHEHISAYALALSAKNEIGYLNMSNLEAGGAIHNFGNKLDQLSVFGTNYKIVFRQGMIGMSIDRFIKTFGQDTPDYIKLDVDGNEHMILCGAKATLENSKLKSVLVEVDNEKSESVLAIDRLMSEHGFRNTKSSSVSNEEVRWASVNNIIYARE